MFPDEANVFFLIITICVFVLASYISFRRFEILIYLLLEATNI